MYVYRLSVSRLWTLNGNIINNLPITQYLGIWRNPCPPTRDVSNMYMYLPSRKLCNSVLDAVWKQFKAIKGRETFRKSFKNDLIMWSTNIRMIKTDANLLLLLYKGLCIYFFKEVTRTAVCIPHIQVMYVLLISYTDFSFLILFSSDSSPWHSLDLRCRRVMLNKMSASNGAIIPSRKAQSAAVPIP